MSVTTGDTIYSAVVGGHYKQWTLEEIKDMRRISTLRMLVGTICDEIEAEEIDLFRSELARVRNTALRSLESAEKAEINYRLWIAREEVPAAGIQYVFATVWSWFGLQSPGGAR